MLAVKPLKLVEIPVAVNPTSFFTLLVYNFCLFWVVFFLTVVLILILDFDGLNPVNSRVSVLSSKLTWS